MTNPNKTTLNRDTLVPLGMVVSICAAVVWLNTQINSLHYKLDMLESKFENQWTMIDMENWSLKLRLKNPTIKLPSTKGEDG